MPQAETLIGPGIVLNDRRFAKNLDYTNGNTRADPRP